MSTTTPKRPELNVIIVLRKNFSLRSPRAVFFYSAVCSQQNLINDTRFPDGVECPPARPRASRATDTSAGGGTRSTTGINTFADSSTNSSKYKLCRFVFFRAEPLRGISITSGFLFSKKTHRLSVKLVSSPPSRRARPYKTRFTFVLRSFYFFSTVVTAANEIHQNAIKNITVIVTTTWVSARTSLKTYRSASRQKPCVFRVLNKRFFSRTRTKLVVYGRCHKNDSSDFSDG